MTARIRGPLKYLSLNTIAIVGLWTGIYGQAQPPPKENANVISGRITTNDNQSLTNARVMVSRVNSNTIGQSVRVDSEGNFRTQSLEPGLYSVSAYVPGWIQDSSAPGIRPYNRPGDTVDFKLIKGGVITGSVKNANGEPLVAVPVRAIRIRYANGDMVPFTISMRETLTDDRGIYRLFSLISGTYIVSAGGQSRNFGLASPTAYEGYVPTYAPSATRDTATEIPVTSGSESQVDIQFREERGHVISGTITGVPTSDGPVQYAAGVAIYDPRSRAEVATGSAVSMNNYSFAVYGLSDGDYEIYATQLSSTNDQMASAPMRIKVQGADVTGLQLMVAPLASLDGRVTFENDPKAACGKDRASVLIETMIAGRRYEPRSPSRENPAADVPFTARSSSRSSPVDSRGGFSIKNLQPGSYQVEPTAPAAGWFVRSAQFDRNPAVNVSRDGVLLKRGERVAGLTVAFAEGAAKLTGHLSASEGQSLPLKLRVYLVPEERAAAGNLYRYYEAAAARDGSFAIDNVAPGKYLILARLSEENEIGVTRLVRLDENLRTNVLKEAEVLKKAIAFKPCEQVADYDLPYVSSPR